MSKEKRERSTWILCEVGAQNRGAYLTKNQSIRKIGKGYMIQRDGGGAVRHMN